MQGVPIDSFGDIGLETITFPAFLSLDRIQNFSVFSYLAFIFSLVFVLIAVLWVILVIRAGIKIVQSQGDPGQIQEGQKKIGNVMWSITFLFGFFVILAVILSFFGLGSFWTWPQKLSFCENGQLYVTFALQPENQGLDDDTILNLCVNATGNSNSGDRIQQCRIRCGQQGATGDAFSKCVTQCASI